MKILHITDAASGGVLTSLTALARNQAAHPEVSAVGVRYTPRADSPSRNHIAAGLGPMVDLHCWSPGPGSTVLTLIKGIIRELREDWDLIHLHSSRAGFLGRILALAVPSHAHLVYSPHGFSFNQTGYPQFQLRIFKLLERIALLGSRDLALVSPGEAELAAEVLPGVRTAILANAVDPELFAPKDSPGLTSRTPAPLSVIQVGRIMSQKRPELFAEVARLAEIRYPGSFTFTWIGEGERNLLSACPEISITGWITGEEIRSHLSNAALMLFTSAGEGMPMSLLEAASAGVPTVGSDVIGVRDLIDHRVDGMLFRTADEAVDALFTLTDADIRSSMAAAARRRVLLKHNESTLASNSLQVYRKFMTPASVAESAAVSNAGSRAS